MKDVEFLPGSQPEFNTTLKILNDANHLSNRQHNRTWQATSAKRLRQRDGKTVDKLISGIHVVSSGSAKKGTVKAPSSLPQATYLASLAAASHLKGPHSIWSSYHKYMNPFLFCVSFWVAPRLYHTPTQAQACLLRTTEEFWEFNLICPIVSIHASKW